MTFRGIFLAFALFVAHLADAQSTVITGKVTDAETGEPIPFATVQLKGTLVGAKTSFEGYYSIITTQKSDSIIIFCLGYETRKKPIENNKSQVIDVQLSSRGQELKELVIRPGINPAFRILEEVWKHKPLNNPSSLTAYQFDAYSKLEIAVNNISEDFKKIIISRKLRNVLDSANQIAGEDGRPVLPVFISESFSTFYRNLNPERNKEVVQSTKVTGVGVTDGTLMSQLVGAAFTQYNLYDNYIYVADKQFVSPISEQGKLYYIYTLKDSAFIDHYWCYEIQVNKKHKSSLAFNGTIWVADTVFALKQIVLEIGSEANINWIEKLKVQQEYLPTAAGPWLPVKERVSVDADQVTKNAASMVAKFYATRSQIIVNQPKPKSFFDQTITVQEDALSKPDSFWNTTHMDHFSNQDHMVYQMVDSLKNLRVVRNTVALSTFLTGGYKSIGKIDIGPYFYLMGWNVVEGPRFRFGARTNGKMSKKWFAEGYGAYGIGDQKWKGAITAQVILSRKTWTLLGGKVRHDVEALALSDQSFLPSNNFFTAFSMFSGLQEFARVNDVHAWLETNRIKGLRLRIIGQLKYFQEAGNYRFAFIHPESGLINNQFNQTNVTLDLRYCKKETFIIDDNERLSTGRNGSAAWSLTYTHGFSGVFGSTFAFDKLKFNVSQYINMGFLGQGYYSLGAYRIFQPLPYPLIDIARGNPTIAYSLSGYNTMNFMEFMADQSAYFHYEHNFEGLFFNRLPLIKKWKLRAVATNKMWWGKWSSSSRNLIPAYDEKGNAVTQFLNTGATPFWEVGYGIENIFRILRVDAIHRLTYLSNPHVRPFQLKISFQLKL